LKRRTALILLDSRRLRIVWTRKRINAVRHHNSVFHDLLNLVPWAEFDRLVDEHGSDELVRKFKSRHQFVALVYGQLAGASSLREIEATMASHQSRLYHVGGRVPRRSTFADANRSRSPLVFTGLFQHMLGMATRAMRRKMDEVVLLIDSTSLHLAGIGSQWARFSAEVCGAKAHVVYDPDLACPVYHAISAANVNDITPAKMMPIQPGATYVFDLGYYDYAWWADLDRMGCRIVTRFKTNTLLLKPRDTPIRPGSGVLSDRIGFLPARQAKSRRNPMQVAVREVIVTTETGKQLRILTNDLDASAQEISDLYKRRWLIELFFRLMKQMLRITRFIGRSENAVRIQIAVALITFLLLHLLQTMTKVQHGLLELVRLVRTNLMHRKDITRLRQIQAPPLIDPRQLVLNWANT
jgi:low affinity Fe/Cu permease